MIRFIFFVFISGTVLTRSLEPYHVSSGSSVWGYFTPPVIKRPQQLRTPMEAMVDLTNSLGVAILQDHSYSRGNFAFSPYGVASVLVVLYEGAGGESANQIYRSVGFPANKDILRTGFRDIHRHLRSYFSHEGFLSGITLNKNGSNLKSEYKKILKFYGYDVELSTHLEDECKIDQEHNSSTEGIEPTKPAVTTTLQPITEKLSTSTETKNEEMDSKIGEDDLSLKKPEESFSTEKEITVGGDDIFTTTLVTPVKETLQTTNKVNDSELDVTTTLSLKEQQLTTVGDVNIDHKTTAETTMVPSELTTESTTEESTQTEIERVKKRNESVTEKSDYDEIEPVANAFPEDVTVNTPGISEPDDYKEKKVQENLETGEKKEKCREDRDPNGRSQESEILCKEELERTGDDQTESPIKALESKPKEVKTDSEEIKLDNGMLIPQADKKPTKADLQETTSEFSLLEFTTNAIDSNESKEIFVEESSSQKSSGGPDIIESAIKPNKDRWEKQLRKMFDSKSSLWVFEPRKKSKRTFVERHRRTIADYLKWPLNPDLSLQLQNGMYDTHVSRNAEMYRSLPRIMFLVDGAVDTPVPMMTYTNIFPYGYIPKLHAKALEFPLDDIRYKLLIVLPIERRGLRQLIYDLADFSVRDVLKCLQPTRVKAMIPTFMVEGFVILTSSLQKLGIWDVFDPRKANLSGMSVDPELYVRNIEQSVTVVIRNYVEILDIQTRTMAARYLEHEFQATHPFVYFVLDTATNIALMAGQMLDPLNSRIY